MYRDTILRRPSRILYPGAQGELRGGAHYLIGPYLQLGLGFGSHMPSTTLKDEMNHEIDRSLH